MDNLSKLTVEYLYLVNAQGTNDYKIGKSCDIERRIKEIQTCNPKDSWD